MVLLPILPESSAELPVPHKTWTREELLLVEETGVFEGAHFELVEGELIDKMGKKRPHAIATRSTVLALEVAFGRSCVEQEAPIDVAPLDMPRNEPEPDVIALRRPSQDIEDNPSPNDLAIVVEISDTSLRQDLNIKSRLYARAGISEYWVVDLKNRRLHVFRDPKDDAYETRFELLETGSISPLERPGHTIAVATLLG